MAEKDTDELTEALQKDIEYMDAEIGILIGESVLVKKDDAAEEEKHPSEPDEPKKDKDEDSKKKNNTATVVAGISNAYADDIKAMPQKTEKSSKSSWPKPPARGKNDVKVANGKDIMEVFWNEMWALYDKILDFVVDTALDFVVFVLYPEKPASGYEKKNEKADAIAAGEQAYNSQIQKIRKQKAQAFAVHKEIKDNLQKTIDGESVEWKILKKEPDFYAKLVEIKKKALNAPNSPEAKMISEFEKMPETFEQMAENCEKMMKFAVNLAAMEEYVSPKTKDAEINRLKEQYKNNPDELKKKLEEIDAIYKNPKKEQEQMAERINSNAEGYYNNIIENIGKIRAANEDNPEKMQKELAEYMGSMSASLKDAKELIYDKIYKDGKDSKKNKENAVSKIAATINIVNGTMQNMKDGHHDAQDLQKIALTLATMEEFLNPSAKAAEIEAAKKQYSGKAQKEIIKEIEEEYKNPETLKKKTSKRIKDMADEHCQQIRKTLDNIERTYANNPEEKKKALEKYTKQVFETLQETRKKVYLKKEKGKDINPYIDGELNKLDNGEKGETAKKEDINVHSWSTSGILNMIKQGYGHGK